MMPDLRQQRDQHPADCSERISHLRLLFLALRGDALCVAV